MSIPGSVLAWVLNSTSVGRGVGAMTRANKPPQEQP
jgi:hypothetical protein